MPKSPTKSQLERSTALARYEVEELSLALEAGEKANLAYLRKVLGQLKTTLDLPVGLRVGQVADQLGVSQPTVRKWIDEGLLEKMEERTPAEVTQQSVVRVARILAVLQERFPSRAWSEQLAAFLHDRDLQQQEWFRKGIEEGQRGEYVEL